MPSRPPGHPPPQPPSIQAARAWFSCSAKRVALFPSSFRFVHLTQPTIPPGGLCCLCFCYFILFFSICIVRRFRPLDRVSLFPNAGSAASSCLPTTWQLFWGLHSAPLYTLCFCMNRIVDAERQRPDFWLVWLLQTLSNVSLRQNCSTPPPLTRRVLKLLLQDLKSSTNFMRLVASSTASRAPRSRLTRAPSLFGRSTSRVRVLPNIPPSKRRLPPGWRSKLSCRLRFENDATNRICHSNHPCPKKAPCEPRVSCHTPTVTNSISCPMPQVSQASTATDQSAPSFGFLAAL